MPRDRTPRTRLRLRTIAASTVTRRGLLLIAILLLCGAGGALSLGLLQAHVDPAGALVTRFCPADGAAGSGCAAALDSRWGRISVPMPRPTRNLSFVIRRVNVPVAFLGAAYFAFLGSWFGLIGTTRPIGARWHLLVLAIAIAGGGASLVFIAIMALTRTPWCVLCLAVHGVNFALVPVVWLATRRPLLEIGITAVGAARFARLVLTPREAIVAALTGVVLIGGMWGYWRQARIHRYHVDRMKPLAAMVTELRADRGFLLREFTAEPVALRQPVPLRPSETPAVDAPVLMIFSDYECPACRCRAAGIRASIRRRFADRVQVLVRHFPLCRACNDTAADAHPNACDAAYAAEAARLQGGEDAFLRMHDALFAYEDALGPHVYPALAREIGLDPDRLARDMAGAAVRRTIADDVALAKSLGVKGTPTMILDGRPIPDICDTDTFWTAYVEQRAIDPAFTKTVYARPEPTLSPSTCTHDHPEP